MCSFPATPSWALPESRCRGFPESLHCCGGSFWALLGQVQDLLAGMLMRAVKHSQSDLWCTTAAPVSRVNLFWRFGFRAFNTRTPTETLRQSTATASPLRSYFLYEERLGWFCLTIKARLNFWTFQRIIAGLYVTLFTLHKCVELHAFHPWWSSGPRRQLISVHFTNSPYQNLLQASNQVLNALYKATKVSCPCIVHVFG